MMDAVGRRILPSFERMRRIFDLRRKQNTLLQRALHHAMGLEMKLRQYELGQQFCESVSATAGPAVLRRLWDDPGALPSLTELERPELWLRRAA